MWYLLIWLLRLRLCSSGALAWCLGIKSFQQLLLPDASLHLPSHLLPLQNLLSQTFLLLNLQTILPCLLILIRVLWHKAQVENMPATFHFLEGPLRPILIILLDLGLRPKACENAGKIFNCTYLFYYESDVISNFIIWPLEFYFVGCIFCPNIFLAGNFVILLRHCHMLQII